MDINKKDYPVTIKINGDAITVHLSINDIVETFWSMSDAVFVYIVTRALKNYSHSTHKEIAKKMNLR